MNENQENPGVSEGSSGDASAMHARAESPEGDHAWVPDQRWRRRAISAGWAFLWVSVGVCVTYLLTKQTAAKEADKAYDSGVNGGYSMTIGGYFDYEDEDENCDHEYDDDQYDESLNVDDAALIYLSSGMDEDYTFGYSDIELRRSLSRD